VITFRVLGVPAPQGSKTRMPNGAMLEAASQTGRDKVKAWRTAVADTAHQHRPETPLDGPLHLTVAFYMPRPKARTKAVWADRKPDLSKLLRATEDALTDSGMISDDSRIVDCTITKRYSRGTDPWTGADITIATLEDGS